MHKVVVAFGTRPEAIKMAPVVQALSAHPRFEPVVVVTGQHRTMLDQVLRQFAIEPDIDLNVMQPRQSLTEVTTRILQGLEPVLREIDPAMVLVHGDTATTFAASLAAFYRQIPVGHVEAGLRTYRKYEPFPEEVYRRLADVIADVHFAPTPRAKQHLLAEKVPAEGIFVTGNTAIDALLQIVRRDYAFTTPGLAELPYAEANVVAVEVHRRENWGTPIRQVFEALKQWLQARPDVHLLLPVHENPEVADVVNAMLAGEPRAHLFSPPLDYPEWVNAVARCRFVITDSGGMQEEAPALGKPVLLVRSATERPEAVAAGTVWQVGTDPDALLDAANALLDDAETYERMAKAQNPFGDGRAAKRTIAALEYVFGLSQARPEDWAPAT